MFAENVVKDAISGWERLGRLAAENGVELGGQKIRSISVEGIVNRSDAMNDKAMRGFIRVYVDHKYRGDIVVYGTDQAVCEVRMWSNANVPFEGKYVLSPEYPLLVDVLGFDDLDEAMRDDM